MTDEKLQLAFDLAAKCGFGFALMKIAQHANMVKAMSDPYRDLSILEDLASVIEDLNALSATALWQQIEAFEAERSLQTEVNHN